MNGCGHVHNCIDCRRDYNCWNGECMTLSSWVCGTCVWQAHSMMREAAKPVHGSLDQSTDRGSPKAQIRVELSEEPPPKRHHYPRRRKMERIDELDI